MYIRSLEVEPGKHEASSDEILAEARSWLEQEPLAFALFARFQSSSGVRAKRLVIPASKVRSLQGSQERSEIFLREGLPMLERVALRAIASSGISPEEFGSVIFTSCSAPTIPAVDVTVLPRLGLRRDVTRLPIYQHGCAGGVVALGLADRLSESGKPVLLLSLELCSLSFFSEDTHASGLIGAAIFADGAAATAIAERGPGMRILGSRSVLIPETEHLMGYNVLDNGSHLRLDRELPSAVLTEIKESLPLFLAEHGKKLSDVSYYLMHPGGAKILDHIEAELGISRDQCRWSWEVLQSVGNMSSTSISFVIRAFLDSEECCDPKAVAGKSALVLGIGPGLTVQYVLCEL